MIKHVIAWLVVHAPQLKIASYSPDILSSTKYMCNTMLTKKLA